MINSEVLFLNEYYKKLKATRDFPDRDKLYEQKRDDNGQRLEHEIEHHAATIKNTLLKNFPDVCQHMAEEELTNEARSIAASAIIELPEFSGTYNFGNKRTDKDTLIRALNRIANIDVSFEVNGKLNIAMLVHLPVGGIEELDPNCYNQKYRDYPYGMHLGAQTNALDVIKHLVPYLIEAIETVDALQPNGTTIVRNRRARRLMRSCLHFWKNHECGNLPESIRASTNSKLISFCVDIFEIFNLPDNSIEKAYAVIKNDLV